MARTRGAKDRTKRRILKWRWPVVKAQGQTTPPAPMDKPPVTTSSPERPAIPASDFKAAIAAELGKVAEPDCGGTVPELAGTALPVTLPRQLISIRKP